MSHSSVKESQRTILIVDDSPMGLRLLAHMMEMHGYHAECVTSGAEALALAWSTAPDLVLLDIMMPDMDGFEVARRLHADARTHDIPIIFISALSDEKSKVRAFVSGAVDYVSKPLQMDEIIARVETHLRLRDATQRLRRQLTEREALYRITRSLITSEDIPDMLQTVTDSVVQALSADRVLTVTLDLEAETITFLAKGGVAVEETADPTFETLMEGLTGWVVEHVQPVLSPKGRLDPRESPRIQQQRKALGIGAALVVPLYYQGAMMGTMTATNGFAKRDFDEQDLAQFSAVAGQVSVALANARLSDETARLKEFNEGIVQGVAEAILIMDRHEHIIFANPAALSMLGYSLEALLGQPSSLLLSDERLALPNPALLVDSTSTVTRFETVVQNAEGRPVPVLASIRPLFQEGELTGALAALTDITEIKEAEAKLRSYAADLEAQNAELNAFAHTVAHDLRNPLTGIIGFVDLLERAAAKRDDAELAEYAHYLHRNSVKMNNIIDELLLLASVREMETIKVRPLDMGRLVREAQRRLDYLIAEHKAEIVVAETWPLVVGYPPWIEEVWTNYLSNAIKYGGHPARDTPPRVQLGFDHLNGADSVRFWVRDNGPGLTAEEVAQLFTPFERLHNVRAEGHGLGLSIVRRILEKLNGKVGVESNEGAGSTFYFTLPRA